MLPLRLASLLRGHANANFLIQGFSVGFKVGYHGLISNISSRNSSSVSKNPSVARSKIRDELSLNRLDGPFRDPPFDNFIISPLAVRQKRNSHKHRLLHNLSAPYDGSSVNFNIPDDHAKVKYQTIRDAIQIILQNDYLYMVKTDIAEAFRQIPLHPSDYPLMGFKLDNLYFFDKCLPMGCRSACAIFETFSDSLLFILRQHFNITSAVKVLDDFLFLAPTFDEAQNMLDSFLSLASLINLPIAAHKTEGPSRSLDFLGLLLDTDEMVCKLPPDKLSNYSSLVNSFLSRSSCSLRELRELTGKLAFASAVIDPGRTFLRRLYNAQIGHSNPSATISISPSIKDDLLLWQSFLSAFNGKTLFKHIPSFNPITAQFGSDSSKSGYGATFHPFYLLGTFPDSWTQLDIQTLELYPIFLLLHIFKSSLRGKRMLIYCDNLPLVHNINSLTSKNPRVMSFLRSIVLTLMKYNISFLAAYIPSIDNTICDLLSRQQIPTELLRQHGFRPLPHPIPTHLRPHNLKLYNFLPPSSN